MFTPTLPHTATAPPRWLVVAAALLRHASAALDRVVAARAAPRRHAAAPTVEFHAEAGAPEGALYVDGVLVGRVVGVTRL